MKLEPPTPASLVAERRKMFNQETQSAAATDGVIKQPGTRKGSSVMQAVDALKQTVRFVQATDGPRC